MYYSACHFYSGAMEWMSSNLDPMTDEIHMAFLDVQESLLEIKETLQSEDAQEICEDIDFLMDTVGDDFITDDITYIGTEISHMGDKLCSEDHEIAFQALEGHVYDLEWIIERFDYIKEELRCAWDNTEETINKVSCFLQTKEKVLFKELVSNLETSRESVKGATQDAIHYLTMLLRIIQALHDGLKIDLENSGKAGGSLQLKRVSFVL